jgi:hypothetical protein
MYIIYKTYICYIYIYIMYICVVYVYNAYMSWYPCLYPASIAITEVK